LNQGIRRMGGEVSEIVCKNCGAKNLIPNWE
jgi:hypothetical protein